MSETVYVSGLGSDQGQKSISTCIRDVFLKSTNNLEWLSPGDCVLLKPAINSDYPYPSTTHPLAIKVLSEVLTENGAQVVVGDQSGIRHVLHNSNGVIRGNTRKNYLKSGVGVVKDNFVSFEEEGWDEGFYHHSSKNTPSWPHGFFITNWIKNVDHIINLPRLSTHSQAGATLGFKNMVGILREDSRMEFHANGPYNIFIKNSVRGSGLSSVDDQTDTFLEKIVEISDSVKEKLRSTLFVATQAQSTFGPNKYALGIGNYGLVKAHVVDLEPGLVWGSSDPVAAEYFALLLLKDIKKSLNIFHKLYQRLILFSNDKFFDVDKFSAQDHPYIKHAVQIGLGYLPGTIKYDNVPLTLQERLNNI